MIINITSAAARTPFANNSLYNASKSAAAMLTRTAAVEAGKHNIRIIEVAPGPIETPMLRFYLEKEGENGSPVSEGTVEARRHAPRPGRKALTNFSGCAVIISHDRFYLDRIATHMLAFDGDSHVNGLKATLPLIKKTKSAVSGSTASSPPPKI